MNFSSLSHVKPPPISREEFARFFQKCTPPIGWSEKIGASLSAGSTAAVATSGGADSTCLLFLIRRYIQDTLRESPESDPSSIVSMTVDHGFQASSEATAKHCADHAKSLGIEHFTLPVPWSQPPFPDRPQTGEAFEEIGRNVRYHLLFNAMQTARADILALGHHGDDQVETSLMRLAKGTTEIGAGGMRRTRRWGMGSYGADVFGWTGVEGMSRWMVRPLLEVSKDRILATCDENKLEYITDHTNFQPEVTLRNAIRKMVQEKSFDPQIVGTDLPPHIADGLNQIRSGMSALQSVDMDPSAGLEELRASVTVLSEQVQDMDELVDTSLNRCHLPSPTGTYLVSYRGLSTIRDPLVQRGLILRIMRYVSFHGWGTVRADANRRKASIDRIIKPLWTPDPFKARISPFVAGGGVLWSPVKVGGRSLKIPQGPTELLPGEIVGWLASRQPPLSAARMQQQGMTNPLRMDITDLLREKLLTRKQHPGQVLKVLWDCRFFLHIEIDKIPLTLVHGIMNDGDSILVRPNTRWYWPALYHYQAKRDTSTVLHSTLSMTTERMIKLDRDIMESWPFVRIDEVTAEWVRTEWIRSLSAL
ncbi:PP-loop family-domain-containing protein [Mycena crocata]|nr:PP-loop family-domain-containing protein [Mycena crocata]